MRCNICRTKIKVTKENVYTAREKVETGVSAAFKSNLEPTLWDAVDCPNCGCQTLIKTRLRKLVKPLDKPENSDNNELKE